MKLKSNEGNENSEYRELSNNSHSYIWAFPIPLQGVLGWPALDSGLLQSPYLRPILFWWSLVPSSLSLSSPCSLASCVISF